MPKLKPGTPFEDDDWAEEDYYPEDYDDPPCEHCGAMDWQPHKHGCHLLKAIAEALEKDGKK